MVPVPLRDTVCGLPDELSEMDSVAVRGPIRDGLKVTLMLHAAPESSELPQV